MSTSPPSGPVGPRGGGFGRARPVDERTDPSAAGAAPAPIVDDTRGPWDQPASSSAPVDTDTSRWDVAPASGWNAGRPAAEPSGGIAATAPIVAPIPPSKAPVSGVKAVTCPNCGGTVEMHAAGYSVSVACQYCGSILDVASPEVALIERNNRAAADLEIPLGSRGLIRGTEFQMVGYMRRSIDGEGWDEYLLFNPYVGYRWLVNEDDEWSFGTMLVRLPDTRQMPLVRYGGVTFEHDGDEWDAVVDSVVGEFYWRVGRGERATLMNFEGGGATLSSERVADEVNWTIAQPIAWRDIRGFGQGGDFVGGDAAATPGLNPSGGGYTNDTSFDDYGLENAAGLSGAGPVARAWLYTKLGAAAAAFMVVVMVLFSFGGTGEQSFSYELPLDAGERTVTFGPVTFGGSTQRVSITSNAPGIDNAWIDADIRLVERTTQNSISAYDVIERYSGTDSDGAWSEGGDRAATGLASVPAGTYDIIIDASAHSWPGGGGGFTSSLETNGFDDGGKPAGIYDGTASAGSGQMLRVTTSVSSGGVFFSNFVLGLLLLAIPPLFLLWRGYRGRGR